jgi:hypothetical protein
MNGGGMMWGMVIVLLLAMGFLRSPSNRRSSSSIGNEKGYEASFIYRHGARAGRRRASACSGIQGGLDQNFVRRGVDPPPRPGRGARRHGGPCAAR